MELLACREGGLKFSSVYTEKRMTLTLATQETERER